MQSVTFEPAENCGAWSLLAIAASVRCTFSSAPHRDHHEFQVRGCYRTALKKRVWHSFSTLSQESVLGALAV